MQANERLLWWQEGIIYQVYPRSFQDSDGDGVGDLRGILQRLDHLVWLGVTAIWISPVYPSPMADFGYDVSDYRGIHPLFGSMEDFDALLAAAHGKGLRIILDFVPNHTSDQHPWFIASRASRDSPKRDWYLWKDGGEGGALPNNWLAAFGGPAWTWDEGTGQYYYHAFLKEQPDLNWRNPEVVEAMLGVMKFWLDKGVDGFRVDVIWHLIKDEQWRDNPENPGYQPHQSTYDQLLPVYSTDQPEVHGIIARMRELLDTYTERMMVGEIYLPVPKLVTYYGGEKREAHLPFNFLLISLPWEAERIAAAIQEYEAALPPYGWPNWVLGNHDQPRIAGRIGLQQARVAAVLLLTLRGTPTLYYGDELGMPDVAIPQEEVQDPQGRNMQDKHLSRDPARTPMQWDSTEGAGFTTARPWLRLGPASKRVNVAVQRDDPYSMLQLYRRLVQLRQQEPALRRGAYVHLYADRQVICYLRKWEGADSWLVILNLTHRPCRFTLPDPGLKGEVVVSASGDGEGALLTAGVSLAGDEAVVVRVKS